MADGTALLQMRAPQSSLLCASRPGFIGRSSEFLQRIFGTQPKPIVVHWSGPNPTHPRALLLPMALVPLGVTIAGVGILLHVRAKGARI